MIPNPISPGSFGTFITGKPSSPIGITRLRYSLVLISCVRTSLNTLQHSSPTTEQNAICQRVKAIGNGNPLYAKSHLLKRMTVIDMVIHIMTYV